VKITLLVPTFNEIDGMKVIMPRVRKDWCDQIIILDGGSTDGTVDYAKEQGYFVIVTFSPDGNSIPELIPALINKMQEGYDMVIGSRYLDGARSEDDDVVTAFGNWFFTKTINVLHGGQYTDAMVIFRAYKTQLIYDLQLDKDEAYLMAEQLFHTTVSWEPLLSVRAAKRKLRVAEIPADEPARVGGSRKLQVLRWGGAYYFQFLRETFVWK
jgi:glycosyltransferase involved in cell wall biosynthesis